MQPPPAALRQAPGQHRDEGSLHLSKRKHSETLLQRVTMPSQHNLRAYVPELNPPLPVRQDRVHPAAY